MLTFNQAIRRHALLKQAVARVVSNGWDRLDAEELAANLWSGVVGAGRTDTISQAVSDTTPSKWSTLLATDDIVAAFAVSCLLDAFGQHGPSVVGEPPIRCRNLAQEGWEDWLEIANQSGYLEHRRGQDDAAAWPTMLAITLRQVDGQKIRRIAELAGRMFAVLQGVRSRRVAGVPEETTGIKLGGDIRRLIPSEYARMGQEQQRKLLLLRVARKQALEFRREGRLPQGRGPLVVCVDESGSMENNRNIWAKSVATALIRTAWEDKRPCSVVHFSKATRVTRIAVGDQKALLKMQQSFLDGGTCISTALAVATDEVKDLAAAGVTGADIVLISDGADSGHLRHALDAMDREKVRLFGIAIACSWSGQLRDRAASYTEVGDDAMDDDQAVASIANAVSPGSP